MNTPVNISSERIEKLKAQAAEAAAELQRAEEAHKRQVEEAERVAKAGSVGDRLRVLEAERAVLLDTVAWVEGEIRKLGGELTKPDASVGFNLKDQSQRVLRLMADNQERSSSEIATELGLTSQRSCGACYVLFHSGRLDRRHREEPSKDGTKAWWIYRRAQAAKP